MNGSSYQGTVKEFLQQPTAMSRETFLSNSWSKPFLHVAHEYFAFLTDIETYNGTTYFEDFQQNSTDLWHSFLEIEQYLHMSAITVDQMKQKFGRDVKRLYDLKGNKP
jgi:hypothetical protein